MNKLLKTVLRFVLSAFFIFLAFKTSGINLAQVKYIIQSASLIYFPIIALLIVLNYAVSTYRWRDLVLVDEASKPSYNKFLSLYFIGSFFNNFLVTSIGGDAYKIFKLGKKINDNAMAVAATFMDRFTGFLLLVLISYFGFIFTWRVWFDFANSFLNNSKLTYFILALCLLGFWIGTGAFFLSLNVLSKKVNFAKKLLNSLSLYKGEKNKLLSALITSLAVQLFAVFSQYFVFSSIGHELPLTFALCVIPVITLAGFFIPSINGIGVQDYMYKELFLLVGIPAAYSLSASILYHFLRLAVSLVGGVLYALGKADK
jgi:uncharacterized protein (TIRG00374 family)